MRSRAIPALLLLGCLLLSCRKPAERMAYISTPSHPADTFLFRYDIMLDEPGGCYSTRIACRCDAAGIGRESIPLLVAVVSPSGERSMEIVEMPLASGGEKARMRRSSGSVVDMEWSYRERIVPGRDTGLWHISIRPVDRKMMQSIYGMGFSYTRNTD